MEITRLDTAKRMSQSVSYGGLVYLAGQVAIDKPDASVTEQTRNVLERVDAMLARAGSGKERILSATIYLADISTFDEMNSAWDEWVPAGASPARATVEAKLADPEFAVEISIVAAVSG